MKNIIEFLKWSLDRNEPFIFLGVIVFICIVSEGIAKILRALFWGQ